MHMILRYPDGNLVDALLLSRGDARMRVILRGKKDRLELNTLDHRWVDEDGQEVSIEAIVSDRFDARSRAAASAAF